LELIDGWWLIVGGRTTQQPTGESIREGIKPFWWQNKEQKTVETEQISPKGVMV
jgi:hypothetical protein